MEMYQEAKLSIQEELYTVTQKINGGKEVFKNVMGHIADTTFDIPNQRVMEEMLNRPWYDSTFSKRLWKNTQVLASNINELLTFGLTQGKTIAEMSIQLSNRMKGLILVIDL